MWLLIERPGTKEVHPQPLTAVLTCGVSNLSLVLSLLYNMLLIILCTFYAFKTRKIPENFNEAKYIGFTMYSTCIVWLAFVAIYFGTYNDYKVFCLFLIFFAPSTFLKYFCVLKRIDSSRSTSYSTRYFHVSLCYLLSTFYPFIFFPSAVRSKRLRCACASISALRWRSVVYSCRKSISFFSSRTKMSAHQEVGYVFIPCIS